MVWGFLPSAQAREIELGFSFWGSYKDLELWKWVKDNFEERHPGVTIRLQYTPNDYDQKLQLQFISRSAPEIMLVGDEVYPAYAVRGYLEDLAPYLQRDAAEVNPDAFLPNAMRAFNYNGLTAALPWDGMPVMMFYNKELFDEAGLPYPGGDWTWEDFRRMAKELTKDLDGDGRPDQFGGVLGYGWLDIEPILWSHGARMLDEDLRHAAIDSAEARAAASLLQALKFEDRSLAWFGDQQGLNKQVQILTGRIAMNPGGWFAAQLLGGIKGGMEWGVCRMPHGPAGRYTRVTYDGIAISAEASEEKKAVAWEFIKFLLSEPAQAEIALRGRGVPVVDAYAEKYFVNPDTPVREELALLSLREDGRLTPTTARFPQLKRVIENAWRQLEKEDPADRKTPDEVMPALAVEINRVMEAELEDFAGQKKEITEKSSAPFLVGGSLLAAVAIGFFVWLSFKTSTPLADLRAMANSRMRRQEGLWGIIFASPWMAGFTMFMAFPIVFSLWLSFSAWDPYDTVDKAKFIGFDNYVRAFTQDPLVYVALSKTMTYAVVAVPLTLCGALALAMLLNQAVRGIGFFRTAFYLPNVVGGVATSIMWLYIFNPIFGPLNGILGKVNNGITFVTTELLPFSAPPFLLPEPNWLTNPDWAMPALFIMMLWGTGGGAMIVFLAGLQGVPEQLYEAAELDGAGRWRKFWNVTIPMLTPTIFFNLIMGIIGALQVFMQAFVLLGKDGGDQNQLLFYVLYLYRKAFIDYEFGYAAALAWILFALILVFTLFILRSSALWVYYEGERR